MDHLLLYLEHFRASDLIDIFIVSVIIYRFLLIVQGTRAFQMLIGLSLLGTLYAISLQYQFYAIHWILSNFFDYFFLILIILFQDSIRSALVSFGVTRFFTKGADVNQLEEMEEVIDACSVLSRQKTGAIIVFEKKNGLFNYAKTGTMLDSKIHSDILYSIFQTRSPLHDGAVLVFNKRIQAAGCFLPLSKNVEIDRQYGTRHRAALGISEVSDCVAIVVSEETGNISICYKGVFVRTQSLEDFRKKLRRFLLEDSRVLYADEHRMRKTEL